MKKRICKVFRCSKKQEMYLYVDAGEALTRVPEALLSQLGTVSLVMTMLVSEHKKLARAEASKVLAEIEEKGFYLQLPPPPEEYMAKVSQSS
ncbi:MAG TPA: YcgL domain-containing protein [Pseudomonadales bacterium]|nr:YcgL domain-containing protein [Pseudomonadales bacterium]